MSDARSLGLIGASRRRLYAALAVNAGFFAVVAYWLSQNVNFADLLAHLRQIPASAIALAMAMNLTIVTFFGARLAAILGDAKIRSCVLIAATGMTFNSLLPFRLGEGIKVYCGSAYFHLPVGGLGAAIVMEKLYDLAMLLFVLAILGATARLPFDIGHSPIPVAVVVIPLCVLLIVRWGHETLTAPSTWPVLRRFGLDSVAAQAETLFARQRILRPACLTLLIWSTNVSLVLFFFRTVAPEGNFGVLEAMTLLVIASLAIAAPVSPAGLGVFEAGIAAYLANVHGFQTEKAISAAIAYHFSITAPHTAITAAAFGGALLARRWRGVRHQGSR